MLPANTSGHHLPVSSSRMFAHSTHQLQYQQRLRMVVKLQQVLSVSSGRTDAVSEFLNLALNHAGRICTGVASPGNCVHGSNSICSDVRYVHFAPAPREQREYADLAMGLPRQASHKAQVLARTCQCCDKRLRSNGALQDAAKCMCMPLEFENVAILVVDTAAF